MCRSGMCASRDAADLRRRAWTTRLRSKSESINDAENGALTLEAAGLLFSRKPARLRESNARIRETARVSGPRAGELCICGRQMPSDGRVQWSNAPKVAAYSEI